MENKKGKLGSRLAGSEAFLSVAASLICIVIGLLLGLVVLAIINAEHAFGDGLLVILKSGFKSPRNMGTVLANIKIYELPNGGSITLFSMVPFILVSFRHGVKWGLFTGFVNSLLQMLLGFYAPPAPGLLPLVGMILLDYVLAFSFLGLACVFAKPFKNKLVGVAVGSAAVCVLRFLCSFLSGVLIWGNLSDGLPAWIYSLTYNGSYMLPEGIMTTIAVVLLYKAAPQLFSANN